MNPSQADMFGAPRPTYVPENAPTETQGKLFELPRPAVKPLPGQLSLSESKERER